MKALLRKIYFRIQPFWYYAITIKSHRSSIKKLEKIVKNKSVYVVGSGPSAENLFIPEEVIVAACNFSPTILNSQQKIHVYLTTKQAITEKPSIVDLIIKCKPHWIATNKAHFLSKKIQGRKINTRHAQLILPFQKLFPVKNLLKDRMALQKKNQLYFFSSGVQLILLSLLAGAKEVNVAGIELSDYVSYANGLHYEGDPANKNNVHQFADSYAFTKIKELKLPVYSLNKSSNLSKIVPHKAYTKN